MDTFSKQLQEYMTSVNNKANYGMDERLAPIMKSLHKELDSLIESIDTTKKDASEFHEKYMKQLEEKEKFYKDKDAFTKVEEKKKAEERDPEPELVDIPEVFLEDIRYGADNIKIAIMEKYLGREAGKKRGETTLKYSSDMLVMVMSGCMLIILGYVSRQVSVQAKNKVW